MENNKTESIKSYADRIAYRTGLIAGALVLTIVVAANLGRNPVPMMGDPLAWGELYLRLIQPIVFISTFITLILGVKKWNSVAPKNMHRGWLLPILPLSITVGLLASTLSEFGIRLTENAFKDLHLAMLQGAAIAAGVAAVVTYYLVKQVITINTSKMLTMLITALAIGVYITMVEISDPYWWRVSFSYLGTKDSSARDIFNHTLKLGGILIVTWVPLFINDFKVLDRAKQLNKHSVKFTKYAFILLGVAIFNVGMFPSRESAFDSFMHNISAYSLVAVFAVFMFGSKWVVPKFSKEFFTTSYVILGILLSCLFFSAIGYFNTVGLEISGFVLGLAWLSQFVGQVEDKADDFEPQSFPK